MMNQELVKQEAKIRALVRMTRQATDGDMELQSHWAKYLCVLVAGFAENALQVLYSDYVSKSTPAPVARFAIGRIKTIQNPRPNRFVEIASGFKEEWGVQLDAFFQLDGRDDAVNSIMQARHQIAHGKNSDISIARVSEYFEKIVEVANFVERQILGP